MNSEGGMTIARSSLGVQPAARGGTFLGQLRSFAVAAWLGWQIESNWADVFLFAVYSVTKPIAGAAILVVMYGVITRGDFDSPLFAYIYLGNAFYTYVGAVMGGISWTIIDDRERYKMLKYVYVSPVRPPVYLIGRGVARFLAGTMSVLVTIVAGMLFLAVFAGILILFLVRKKNQK